MDTFYINMIDENLLKQVVKKFKTGSEGGTFWRSCKRVKMFVEKVKPVWPLPDSIIVYTDDTLNKEKEDHGIKVIREGGGLSLVPLKFCKIQEVRVEDVDEEDYFETVILSDVAGFGGIEDLTLAATNLSEERIRQLLTAANPDSVEIWERYYDPKADLFKEVKNLEVNVRADTRGSCWISREIFEIAKTRKTLTLWLYEFEKRIVTNFLENWLKGEPTGTLEKFIVILSTAHGSKPLNISNEDIDALLGEEEIQSLMTSCVKTEEGYVVEGPFGSLRLVVDIDDEMGHIEFHFSGIHM